MAKKKDNGIVVIGAAFVDIKGYPYAQYIPGGRNSGKVVEVHGGVARNIVEDIANVELRPTFVTVLEPKGVRNDVADKLAKHKVNTDYIKRSEGGLGTWLAVFDNGGDVVASISKRPDLSRIADILDDKGNEIFKYADNKITQAQIPAMVVTMGGDGAVYASLDGESGHCPAPKTEVRDTTGAGDAFFAGVAIGLTYGKSMGESCAIGTRLANSVIVTDENVCPRFLPAEFGLDVKKE